MIDCVLVYPIPSRESPSKGPALSIFYVGVMLEKDGFEVEYVDERFDSRNRTIDLIKTNPLCVGVSAKTSIQLLEAQRILRQTKAINPKTITVLGGPHPSLLPYQCISEESVDIVCIRDGEYTMRDVLRKIRDGDSLESVDGILWKQDGKVIQNKERPLSNPDDLPCPLTEKTKKYYKIAAEAGQVRILSSRGCPNDCAFCFNQAYHFGNWRSMSVEKFEEELQLLTTELDINSIVLGDDNIGKNMKRLQRMCDLLRAKGLTWHTSIRCDYVSKELSQMFDDAGCRSVFFGVESGSERVLNDIIGKQYRNGIDDIRTCARNIGATNISGVYSFMCAIPTETKQELKMSMKLADQIMKADKKARISFYGYAPYPGTRMFQLAVQEGFKEPKTMEEWSQVTPGSIGGTVPENLYYISGLTFRKDKTGQNFPGWKRLLIKPFELTASWRWWARLIDYYWEKRFVKYLMRKASQSRSME
ncbi:B12-binding domain-containing radical SAM protein [Chloroflexota bacterium]